MFPKDSSEGMVRANSLHSEKVQHSTAQQSTALWKVTDTQCVGSYLAQHIARFNSTQDLARENTPRRVLEPSSRGSSAHLGGGVDAEVELALLAIVDGQAFHEE
jgi:hypothetical protein